MPAVNKTVYDLSFVYFKYFMLFILLVHTAHSIICLIEKYRNEFSPLRKFLCVCDMSCVNVHYMPQMSRRRRLGGSDLVLILTGRPKNPYIATPWEKGLRMDDHFSIWEGRKIDILHGNVAWIEISRNGKKETNFLLNTQVFRPQGGLKFEIKELSLPPSVQTLETYIIWIRIFAVATILFATF